MAMTGQPKLTEKKIKFGDTIKYVPHTTMYGHAEFTICSVFKKGFVKAIYIYPRQQPDAEHFYKLTLDRGYKANVIDFTAYGGRHLDQPQFWTTNWCEEHECYSLTFYVPREGNNFQIVPHFGNTISFEFRGRDNV